MSDPKTLSTDAPTDVHQATARAGAAGDVLEVSGIPGAPTRRGVILEAIGEGHHLHYRVRWDEEHESLFYPSSGEGVHVIHPA